MSKRVSFDPTVQERGDDEDNGDGGEEEEVIHPFNKKFKRTLDSDEEDDEEESEKYNIMNPNDFEGEEDGTIRREQDVTITPFNMNEEMEEGHIDKDGMYIFDKKEEEITDHWLDNIDTVQLKEPIKPVPSKEEVVGDEPSRMSTNDCYRTLISLMQPGESVKRAIQRLGKRSKKQIGGKNRPNVSEEEKGEIEVEKRNMLQLISVADQVLDAGDMDIYERTFEQLKFRLKEAEEVSQSILDMFADGDAKEETQVSTESTVSWLLKWEDTDGAQVHGPFTNDQMMNWTSNGYFEKGAFVRQVGKQDSKFYSTRRIDFDLYS